MTISTLILGYKHYGKLIKRIIDNPTPLFFNQRSRPFHIGFIKPRFIQPFTQL